jgi:hypothetical protein
MSKGRSNVLLIIVLPKPSGLGMVSISDTSSARTHFGLPC